MRILENDRIIIKPVEQKDLPFLLDLRWDSDIMKYLIHDSISLESQQVWFERATKSNDMPFSIFTKEDDCPGKIVLAGTVGLYNIHYRHQRATWRLRISSAFQGKGIGFEAAYMILDYGFNTLNLNKIASDIFTENIAIVKLYKKLGFAEEGVVRSHYFHNGCFRDVFNFGLLREDFNKNKEIT